MDEIIKNKNIFIQYDPNAFKNFSSKLFNIDYITKEGLIKSEISGRGKAYEIEFGGNRFILKHYIRGGFVAKISYDKYFFDTLSSSRAVKEYNFLNNLLSKDLPVPKPVALQVIINKFTYSFYVPKVYWKCIWTTKRTCFLSSKKCFRITIF